MHSGKTEGPTEPCLFPISSTTDRGSDASHTDRLIVKDKRTLAGSHFKETLLGLKLEIALGTIFLVDFCPVLLGTVMTALGLS